MKRDDTEPTSTWFFCRERLSNPALRLLCFPPAGGTTAPFFAWSKRLPASWEVHMSQMSGRERRLHEPRLTRLAPLIERLVTAIAPLLDRPFALYGHSLGALVAFELARALRRRRLPVPQHLFVAAATAPHGARKAPHIHHLPKVPFLAEMERRWGLLPEAVRTSPELLDFFWPILQADLEILETYLYEPEPPLPCAITVYWGEKDPSMTCDDVEAWRSQTSGDFSVAAFTDGHFFPQSQCAEMLADVARRLGHATGTAPENAADAALRRSHASIGTT